MSEETLNPVQGLTGTRPMASILGLHHVTATVDAAQADVDFCLDVLGLRLVKKTVNFDNHYVYHFYYGDEHGTPGTIWTTFPYKGHGVRVGTKGAGQITATSFSVPKDSLPFWRGRLADRGVRSDAVETRFGDEGLVVDDPSGLRVELVANGRDTRPGWTAGGIDRGAAIRGVHSVTLTIRSPAETIAFMQHRLGFEVVDRVGARTRVAVRDGAPGQTIDLVEARDAPAAVNGLGTVHHVAMAVATADDQRQVRSDLIQYGWHVTEVLDRQYFTSIYFREPGGVLFEVATVPPGFLVDESLPDLGRSLKLPPWEEPYRSEIEAGLPELHPR
jgi:glyoxalase family protein